MISRNEIDALWRHELAQWLGRPPRIDGRAVKQVPSDKNRVRLFYRNRRDHAPQKTTVSDMPKVQIADQRHSAPTPRRRQVRKAHRNSRDPRPACVENPIESGHYCSTEQ